MTKGFIFNESDLRLVQELINESRATRPTTRRSELDRPGPEVYIMLPPTSGIPGLQLTGDAPDIETGTGTTGTATTTIEDVTSPFRGDSPGFADCDVYRILDGTLQPVGHKKRVYNLALDPISQQWLVPERDKYGNWVVSCPCDTGTGTGDEATGTSTSTSTSTSTATSTFSDDCNEFCSVLPTEWTCTLSGITDNTCFDCDEYNIEYTLTFDGRDFADRCIWCDYTKDKDLWNAILCMAHSNPFCIMSLTIDDALWTVVLKGVTGLAYTWTLASSSANCLSSNTLSLSTSRTDCSTIPSSVTIEPVT